MDDMINCIQCKILENEFSERDYIVENGDITLTRYIEMVNLLKKKNITDSPVNMTAMNGKNIYRKVVYGE